jgi:hypothetical protein
MNERIIMAGLIASILGLIGCGRTTPTADRADIYRDLRQQVLTIDPKSIGLAADSSNRVWGVLMETRYPEGVATLVTIADGTVSLYFSNGGGVIGVGQHDGPRKACAEFISAAPAFVLFANAVTTFPLPALSNTRFYFLTFDGILSVEVKEDDLGNNRHALSAFFHIGQKVITQANLVDDKMRTKRGATPSAASGSTSAR